MNETGPPKEPGVFDVEAGSIALTQSADDDTKPSQKEHASTDVSVVRHSLRDAINRMCKSCIFDRSSNGTWRSQVEACTCSKCPLYPVRPGSEKRPKRAFSESVSAIRAKDDLTYCLGGE